jgi:hypothetical protein
VISFIVAKQKQKLIQRWPRRLRSEVFLQSNPNDDNTHQQSRDGVGVQCIGHMLQLYESERATKELREGS